MNTKIQLHDFVSQSSSGFVGTAAKAPSPKAVQKAAAILKANKQAAVDKLAEKAGGPIETLSQLQDDHSAARKVDNAKIEKLNTQIARIQANLTKREANFNGKVAKLVGRVEKIRKALDDRGQTLKLPKNIASLFQADPSAAPDAEPKPAKKALGKGLKDLVGDKGKTKKAVDKMSSKDSKPDRHEGKKKVPKKMRSESASGTVVEETDLSAKEVSGIIKGELELYTQEAPKLTGKATRSSAGTLTGAQMIPKGKKMSRNLHDISMGPSHERSLVMFMSERRTVEDIVTNILEEVDVPEHDGKLGSTSKVIIQSDDGQNVLWIHTVKNIDQVINHDYLPGKK